MQRARETTATLEHRWNAVALVDARFGEIQSPGVPPEQRKDWLRDFLLRRWSELGQPHDRWRSNVLQAVLGIREDTIVFSHSVAINVAGNTGRIAHPGPSRPTPSQFRSLRTH